MPEPFVLSPSEYPTAWLAYALKWGAALLCVAMCIFLYRRQPRVWWLGLAIAFAWEPLVMVAMSAYAGVPPVPVGFRQDKTEDEVLGPDWVESAKVEWDLGCIGNAIAAGALACALRSIPANSELSDAADSR